MASREIWTRTIADALHPTKAYNLDGVLKRLNISPPEHLNPNNSKKVYVRTALEASDKIDFEELAKRIIEEFAGVDDYALPLIELQKLLPNDAMPAVQVLLFATRSKPQIGSVVLDGSLKILSDGGGLNFDKPIPQTGLTWDDLLNWFSTKYGPFNTEEERLKNLHIRITDGIMGSEVEQLLFSAYWTFTVKMGNFNAPALLPQVWLHYDPLSAYQRGGQSAFVNQRMDFMMFLPDRVRVVIEVDGKQHYAESMDTNAPASPARYAKMMSEDREMKLQGYDVYRFGGAELPSLIPAYQLLRKFFPRLLKRHGVTLDF